MINNANSPGIPEVNELDSTLPNYIIYDIDGVFNPHMATDLVERNFIRYSRGWIDWHLDVVNHAAWVRELEDYADLVWGSSWEEESNALAGWFYLKKTEYPHIDLAMSAGTMNRETWKLNSIEAWIDENVSTQQKVVWVEDEAYEDAMRWADLRPNVLLIITNPAIGLTLAQVESIKIFLS